jgi:hypothetical protein
LRPLMSTVLQWFLLERDIFVIRKIHTIGI